MYKFITFPDSNTIAVEHPDDLAGKKLALKELRHFKKERQLMRKAKQEELQNIKLQYADHTKRRVPMGGFGRFIRIMVQAKRADERRNYANFIKPYEQALQAADQDLLRIDQLILNIEQKIRVQQFEDTSVT